MLQAPPFQPTPSPSRRRRRIQAQRTHESAAGLQLVQLVSGSRFIADLQGEDNSLLLLHEFIEEQLAQSGDVLHVAVQGCQRGAFVP